MPSRQYGLRRRVVAAVLAGALIASCESASTSRRHASVPYNVLLISIDTVRQDILSCYGHRARHAPDVPTTPSLDAFAAQGVRMQDAYASSSWTLPSHISMMTGQTPLVHGVDTAEESLAGPEPTLAEILHRHGYRTRGIFSGPYLDPTWGFSRGFERYRGLYGTHATAAIARFSRVAADLKRTTAGADRDTLASAVDSERTAGDVRDQAWTRDVSSNQVTAGVLEDLRELSQQDAPWFLFAHYFDAHEDYVPPPPFNTRFDPDYTGPISGKHILTNPLLGVWEPGDGERFTRRASDRDLEHVVALYEGEVAWVDDHLGSVLRALDALGLADRTLVIVVSDHGEEFFEHGGLGHHRTLFDESLRVPMLLRLPGVLPSGKTVQGLVSTADLLPTILDVLQLPERTNWIGSASFLPLIAGTDDGGRRSIVARLVTFETGNAVLSERVTVPARQVTVSEAFRRGSIKITRTRRWPQFAAAIPPEMHDAVEAEANARFRSEDLRWIDVKRFANEPEDAHSADFDDAVARAALDAFRDEYALSTPIRRHAAAPSVAPHIQSALRALGYLDHGGDAARSETAFGLPAPGEGIAPAATP